MTPDVLDMSGSHVGTALRVAMHAYHKAARSGFTLMDVSNAPLAKRRKKKNFSSESQKESDDSIETNDSKNEGDVTAKLEVSLGRMPSDSLKQTDGDDSHSKIPALAVYLSPSISRQKITDTSVTTIETTARQPPPLRPISADCDSLQSRSTSSDSNFFFKDVKDLRSNPAGYTYGHQRTVSDSRDQTVKPWEGRGLRPLSHNDSDLYSSGTWTATNNKPLLIDLTSPDVEDSANQNFNFLDGRSSNQVIVQNPPGYNQMTFDAGYLAQNNIVSKSTDMPGKNTLDATSESDVMNNNIVNIAWSELRGSSHGKNSRKRPFESTL